MGLAVNYKKSINSSNSESKNTNCCEHTDTYEGYCIDCGLNIGPVYSDSMYSTNHSPLSNQPTAFVKEVNQLDFPQNVTQKAISIYKKMKISTHRSGKLHQVIFFCILVAYQELNDPQDPKVIARICGVPENKMGSALNICRESVTGYHLSNTYTDPLDLLPKYYIELGLDPSLYFLIDKMARRILGSSRATSLKDMSPQTVAAALLQYFADINGIKFSGTDSKEKISKIVDISTMTISNRVAIIQDIDNS